MSVKAFAPLTVLMGVVLFCAYSVPPPVQARNVAVSLPPECQRGEIYYAPNTHWGYMIPIYLWGDDNVSGSIMALRIASNGTATHVKSLDVKLRDVCGGAIVTPNGRLLLVAETERLEAFEIRTNGSLKRRAASPLDESFNVSGADDPIAGPTDEIGLAVAPNGRTLYVWHNTGFVGHSENVMETYRLRRDGRIKSIAGPWTYVPHTITSVGFIRGGRRMLIYNSAEGSPVEYRVDNSGVPQTQIP